MKKEAAAAVGRKPTQLTMEAGGAARRFTRQGSGGGDGGTLNY